MTYCLRELVLRFKDAHFDLLNLALHSVIILAFDGWLPLSDPAPGKGGKGGRIIGSL